MSRPLPHRIADYFVLVEGQREKAHDTGMTPYQLRICNSYRTFKFPPQHNEGNIPVWRHMYHIPLCFIAIFVLLSIADSLVRGRSSYVPYVSSRYPSTDHSDADFPRDIPMFCFPSGYELSTAALSPICHTYVLTEADGTRIYASTLVVWEKMDPLSIEAEHVRTASAHLRFSNMEELQQDASSDPSSSSTSSTSLSPLFSLPFSSGPYVPIWKPLALTILSHWPFYTQFDRFLCTLYGMVTGHGKDGPINEFLTGPIERVIENFIMEV